MDVPEILPLFPLPEQVLLPGLATPYRVFEPRYRTLVEDLLAMAPERRWLAIPRLAPGWQDGYHQSPAIVPIAAAAVLQQIRALDGGQYLIVVEGRVRCRLEESTSSRPYRVARAVPLPDLPGAATDGVAAAAFGELVTLVGTLARRLGEAEGGRLRRLLDDQLAPEVLVDRLAAALLVTPDRRQDFLECRVLARRIAALREALAALAVREGRSGWQPSEN